MSDKLQFVAGFHQSHTAENRDKMKFVGHFLSLPAASHLAPLPPSLCLSVPPSLHLLLPTPHLTQLARERIAVLPAGSPGEAEIFEPPDGDFAEDRIVIHRQTSS